MTYVAVKICYDNFSFGSRQKIDRGNMRGSRNVVFNFQVPTQPTEWSGTTYGQP